MYANLEKLAPIPLCKSSLFPTRSRRPSSITARCVTSLQPAWRSSSKANVWYFYYRGRGGGYVRGPESRAEPSEQEETEQSGVLSCAGLRVGEKIRGAEILVGPGTSGSRAWIEADRDPGQDLVSKQTVR